MHVCRRYMKARVILTVLWRVLAAWACLLVLLSLLLYFGEGVAGASLSPSVEGRTFLDYLYFSIITGTTVGYGDYVPLGWFRLIAVFDAVSGIVMAGVLVANLTSELLDPLLAVRSAEGLWFKGGDIRNPQGESRPLFTIFVIRKSGRDWLCEGKNYNQDGKYQHRFGGKVVAIDKNTMYVTYQNDPTAKTDYTAGIWILHLSSDRDDILSYKGYSFDYVHGHRDASGGFRVEKLKHPVIFAGLRARGGSREFNDGFAAACENL
jgi:hypothetical protein